MSCFIEYETSSAEKATKKRIIKRLTNTKSTQQKIAPTPNIACISKKKDFRLESFFAVETTKSQFVNLITSSQ